MARYGRKASEKVKKAMRERKRGTLRSGRSGKKVTSRKQAIAIGLSEAQARRRKSSAQESQEKIALVERPTGEIGKELIRAVTGS